MKEKEPKELKVKVRCDEEASIAGKLRKVDLIVEEIKELEESGEYKCTLLEIEI